MPLNQTFFYQNRTKERIQLVIFANTEEEENFDAEEKEDLDTEGKRDTKEE